jgi:hypothetical protein
MQPNAKSRLPHERWRPHHEREGERGRERVQQQGDLDAATGGEVVFVPPFALYEDSLMEYTGRRDSDFAAPWLPRRRSRGPRRARRRLAAGGSVIEC